MQPPYQGPPAPGGPELYDQFPGCYRHPDRPTGVRCIRCNRPICGECQRPGAVGFQCPDDVAAGQATIRQPRTIVGSSAYGSTPIVSYLLLGANILVYLATALAPGGNIVDNTGTTLFREWQLWPNVVGHQHEYYRMLTSAFLHIGPLHLILNMAALYMMGPGLERLLGWWRFAAVYLLGALGGSAMVLLFGDLRQAVAGASGAIFGLFAAAWILSRVSGIDTRQITITIVINFVFTISVPGISKFGHLGGFLIGGLATVALLGWTMNPSGQSSALRKRTPTAQSASLAAILAVLVILSVWRAGVIANKPERPEISASAAVASPSVIHSVENPGENYTGVIRRNWQTSAAEAPIGGAGTPSAETWLFPADG